MEAIGQLSGKAYPVRPGRKWKLVPTDNENGITDDELQSMSVYLAHSGSDDALSAWKKIQPAVQIAFSRT